ncbi:thioredoxin domain-containing protein [Myxococcota bacterium]|nr:thioredoxin domain-containing protein [Myxococcota bacterium]
MPNNHLIDETSPYLLQHADQPVDWHPWGPSALLLSQELDRPVFLSIGYAACHWCHVMAHESFEDLQVAAFLNAHFVCIKVDREERPDLDHLYMQAVIALNGHGGWPMTVFLRPDGRPFFGGTYFPREPRGGLPGFLPLLEGIADAWRTRRDYIDEVSGQLVEELARVAQVSASPADLETSMLVRAVSAFSERFDAVDGGFGPAPKFPPAMALEFLLREHVRTGDAPALEMVETTLDHMADGGLRDQLGGGFCRYSTDRTWLVPHFEKMLTDNALLARVYLHAHLVTGLPRYRQVAQSTLAFLQRELEHPEGGFAGSLDADSPGGEGQFYVWSHEQVVQVLGPEAGLFCAAFDVTPGGNWEGTNILHRVLSDEELAAGSGGSSTEVAVRLEAACGKLLGERGQRARPALDDKRITAWNGLALAAFAEAGQYLHRPELVATAVRCASFLRARLRREDGRMRRTCSPTGEVRHEGCLEDHAYLAEGLLALYRATLDESWFVWAVELGAIMLEHFADPAGGGFFDTADDHEALAVRPKEVQDQATPSAGAVAAGVMLQLGVLTGDPRWLEVARGALEAVSGLLARVPQGFASWLSEAGPFLDPAEVAIVGDPADPSTLALVGRVFARWSPGLSVAVGLPGCAVPLAAQKPMIDGRPTAHVCRAFTCLPPETDPDRLAELFENHYLHCENQEFP